MDGMAEPEILVRSAWTCLAGGARSFLLMCVPLICRIGLLALLAGCAGRQVEQEEPPPPPPPPPVAGEGQVCRYGAMGIASPEETAPPCPEGLSCCYPCGVDGCDWVCADEATCESWSTLP